MLRLKTIIMTTSTNQEISLQSAIDMTQRFRANIPAGFAHSESFQKSAIEKLLNTSGCTSLRIYYGMKENMDVHAILVAVDSEGNDILPSSNATAKGEDDTPVIIEDGFRCPPLCPTGSPLNDD